MRWILILLQSSPFGECLRFWCCSVHNIAKAHQGELGGVLTHLQKNKQESKMGLNKKIALSVAASQAIDASDKKKGWLYKASKKVKGAFNANSKNRKK